MTLVYGNGNTRSRRVRGTLMMQRWSIQVRRFLTQWDLSRHWKWFWQRRRRGFDDRELWSLDMTIAAFIVPRLQAFRDWECGHPGSLTEKEWADRLDDMIWAFEQSTEEHLNDPAQFEVSHQKRRERGLKLFAIWFNGLWN